MGAPKISRSGLLGVRFGVNGRRAGMGQTPENPDCPARCSESIELLWVQ